MRCYLIAVGLVLASCATSWHAPMPLPAASAPAPLAKIKARGPVTVIYQVASPGAVASPQLTDNTRAGSKQGSAATAPAAVASNTSRRTGGGVPWYLWLLVALAGAVGWEWLSHQLPLGWLRWRGKSLLLQKVRPAGQ